jgi:hypothetical protein
MANSSHYFHAEAHALTGKLTLPFEQEIKKQAFVKLQGNSEELLLEGEANKKLKEKKAPENYLSQHAKNFRFEGIISYSAAHTQVSGHRSKKHEGAFVTLASSVVEDLNVLNVVTADRVVAQISTTHFPDVYAPKVTFLGTHFENLRIFRHRVFPKLNLKLGNEGPADKKQRFVQSGSFLTLVGKLYTAISERAKGLEKRVTEDKEKKDSTLEGMRDLPGLIKQDYNAALLASAAIDDRITNAEKKPEEAGYRAWPGIKCSLVQEIEIEEAKREQVSDPITPFGHVLHVHDFGKIFLADLAVNHNSFQLTMIRLELGCLADGSLGIVACNVNGGGGKGGP